MEENSKRAPEKESRNENNESDRLPRINILELARFITSIEDSRGISFSGLENISGD